MNAPIVVSHNTTMRGYELSDIDEIVALLVKVLPTLPNYVFIPADPERIRFLLNHNHTNAGFWLSVLVSDEGRIVGGMGATAAPAMFSSAVIASDVFLYVQPEYRSLFNAAKLVKAYVEWAHARHAVLIEGSHTSGLNLVGMEQLLKRLGFTKVGALYHWRKS